MSPDIEPRERALIEATTSVVRNLLAAHERGDGQAAASELGRLLRAIAAYRNALAERPSDAALRRAISRLRTP